MLNAPRSHLKEIAVLRSCGISHWCQEDRGKVERVLTVEDKLVDQPDP